MCRNIKRLRNPDHAPTDVELHDAAVRDIAATARVLFRSLHVHGHTQAAV